VFGWVAVVVAGWSALACGVAVVLGRVVRLRERQVPRSPGTERSGPVDGVPTPRRPVDAAADRDLDRG
jgi:hypothetical protein